eukprot:TRINITY_DN70871_c0_g1_i1.p1 TRINITY_DN70871_c0_g1~~TRINITY_DN70871_c0_g1_i1.p1  ORF type:complete len:634 (+),score=195.15 TRINITY_DN70871_c0_g1_i1:108-1904(+)
MAKQPAAARARTLFARIDTNHSGRVNTSEMTKALASDAVVRQELGWPGTGDELVALLARDGQGSFGEAQLKYYCEVKDVFGMIDTNHSGRISSWELETALRKSQETREKLGVPPELSNSLFEQIDTNGSGAISLVEFYRYYTAAPLSRPFKHIGDHHAICQRLFRRIDRDGSGGISREEFIAALRDDPEVQLELGQPARHADQLFNFLDANQDGQISEKEFRLFCRAQWIFNGIDINRSGYIDPFELGAALEDPALQRELGRTVAQAQELFRDIDKRSAGMLRFSDFYRWLERQPDRSAQAAAAPAAAHQQPQQPPRAASPAAQQQQQPGRGKSAYDGKELLAEGAFGKVFRVTRRTDKLVLILKEPKPEAGATMEEVTAEAEMLARLKHVNIVRFVDSYQDAGKLYIVTEFCAGGDLRKHQAGRPLPQGDAVRIFSETLEGMKYLHDRGILHRDLKPDNILLSDTRQAKISDFGLAKQASQQQGRGTAIAMTYCGTPFYMAPELQEGKQYGKPNDVWALGCILYEMATGRLCFNNVADIVLLKLPQDAPQWCAQAVRACLQREEARRPTVKSLLADMQHGIQQARGQRGGYGSPGKR